MVLLHVLAAILLGMSIISGGRPEASKRNLNFQSAMWDSSIGSGGSRMVSPLVHFPNLILWPPLFNEYPLWGSS